MLKIAENILITLPQYTEWIESGQIRVEQINDFNINVFKITVSNKSVAILKIYPKDFVNINFDSLPYAKAYANNLEYINNKIDYIITPKLLGKWIDVNTDSWICISWIEGKPMHKHDLDQVLPDFMHILTQIHTDTKTNIYSQDIEEFIETSENKEDYFGNETKYIIKDLIKNKHNWYTKIQIDNFLDKLNSWEIKINQIDEFAFCHNDLVPGNILLDNNKFALIDWTKSRYSSPLYDYACMLWWPYMFSKKNNIHLMEELLNNIKTHKNLDTLPFFLVKRLISAALYYDPVFFESCNKILECSNVSQFLEYIKNNNVPKWIYK